jgi:small subunit ribosomal protein S20
LANIKSQIKRNKQALVARERNKAVKTELKTDIKKFNSSLSTTIEEAKALLHEATVALDKAANKKIIHANEAARKKSVLTKQYNNMVANPPAPVVEEEKPAKAAKGAKGAKPAAKKTAAKKPALKKPAAKAKAKAPAKKPAAKAKK